MVVICLEIALHAVRRNGRVAKRMTAIKKLCGAGVHINIVQAGSWTTTGCSSLVEFR